MREIFDTLIRCIYCGFRFHVYDLECKCPRCGAPIGKEDDND